MKYYDIRKLEDKIISLINYKIIYINSLNRKKVTFATINSRLAICQYMYLKSQHKQGYNVQIFKRGKNITKKVDKMLEQLNKIIEKIFEGYATIIKLLTTKNLCSN